MKNEEIIQYNYNQYKKWSKNTKLLPSMQTYFRNRAKELKIILDRLTIKGDTNQCQQ